MIYRCDCCGKICWKPKVYFKREVSHDYYLQAGVCKRCCEKYCIENPRDLLNVIRIRERLLTCDPLEF